jgi:amino acid transporter
VLALIIATVIYMSVSITAVSVLPYRELSESKAALVDVVKRAAPWFPPIVFTGISIFAVSNTVLLNFVMGSRLLYGMSRQRMLPAALGRVHPARRTPHIAIFILMIIVMTLAVSGDRRNVAAAAGRIRGSQRGFNRVEISSKRAEGRVRGSGGCAVPGSIGVPFADRCARVWRRS